ncbi:hypothetical protein RB25_05550 [Herbaspirillum rubrisubalbicans]|jgi:hypothetical protein|uniref:Uncharacterized protein n=2 Tax=Herbaspirillum rubrisubalbicans TaxID=80842 RepID=A0AAD0XFR3_9BURK|nr:MULTISPECIES: hypothetical protein [Herbaspirillum]AYR23722.1 hypothetical protein RC54_07720 [Herbaspirillum rubrisubalbicans]MCP1576987.1 hypothetical protein [Herbaspirillum rubrisubalbicans]NQE51704.1 hypothetical protein [Herbaspirillum rubrisubalbicans]QJQ00265.1 hypothetical protein C798_08485 [Herbaspirillum rubrisubalbicans Os34]RAM64293.1 hypothetical protein RB24_13115 [Herbaspirillum rubrisubalbicans]
MPKRSKTPEPVVVVPPRFITEPDGFLNVPVSRQTRDYIHHLKKSMRVSSQAEVIEKAVAIVRAIDLAAKGQD